MSNPLLRLTMSKTNGNLKTMADELEKSIERFEMIIYVLTPKVCPTCKYLIVDQDELVMMYHEGECVRCSHVRVDS